MSLSKLSPNFLPSESQNFITLKVMSDFAVHKKRICTLRPTRASLKLHSYLQLRKYLVLFSLIMYQAK